MIKIFMVAATVVATHVFGQEKNDVARDTLKNSYLDEVIISANKVEQQSRLVSQQIHLIRPSRVADLNAQSVADLLANTGVVAMQKSQQGGGSPILRGFEASRVLLVVDGVRMNNLIYRAGHLQNVITLDQNILDRVEVLLGPSSTVYGSDALGGAVVFRTQDPILKSAANKPFNGKSFFRYSSANNEATFHADLNLAGQKTASLTSVNFSSFGDLRMGKKINPAWGEPFGLRNQYVRRSADGQSDELVESDDPFVQRSSGYRQTDVLQKILYRPSDRISHLLNFQFSTSTDIPRYDRLTDPASDGIGLKYAEWYYGPQERLLATYRLDVKNLGKLADRMTLTASYQAVEESRHQRRFNSTSLQHRTEQVDVAGFTVDFQKNRSKNDFRYGIDGQFNFLRSTANAENVLTGASSALDTRYPGGKNRMTLVALYVTHTRQLTEELTLNDGVRIGTSNLYARFSDKTFFPFPFEDVMQKNLTTSASLGLNWTPANWKLSILGSSGFRSPNIDDLAKVFESVAGSASSTGTLIVPNPSLKPEKTLNVDFGVTRFIGQGRIGTTVFATRMFDAITTRAYNLGGQDIITYDGFPAAVFANQNVNNAVIYGASFLTDIPLTAEVKISGAWNWTKGLIRNDGTADTPLDHIAPAYGRMGIAYATKRFRSELFSNFSSWKKLADYSPSGEDNLQYATAEGMPSWYTINLRASADLSAALTFQAGIDNLLDLQYRTFASGINAPGRNVFVALRVRF